MNNSQEHFRMRPQISSPPTQATLFSEPAQRTKALTLEIRGKVVPSFKNNKMLIAKGPSGRPLDRPLLITKPEYQKEMAQIVESFVAQLLSAYQTDAAETPTGFSLASWIACNIPADDCLTVIPEIHIQTEWVEKGNEGAVLTFERI